MNWFADASNQAREIWSAITRHGLVILVLIASLILFLPDKVAETLATCICAILLVILGASAAALAYTSINFSKTIELEPAPVRAAKFHVLAGIYLGTSIVVGLVFFGSYFIYMGPHGATQEVQSSTENVMYIVPVKDTTFIEERKDTLFPTLLGANP